MAEEKWAELSRFRWSSLSGCLSSMKREAFVDYEMILSETGGDSRKGRQGYRKFILSGLEGELENPLELGRGHGIVGAKDFIDWVKGRLLDGESRRREQPALRQLARELDPEALVQKFAVLTGIGREELCGKGKQSVERAMLMELIYHFCRINQPEIGKLVGGLDYAAVSQARGRFRKRLTQDAQLRTRFQEIHNQGHDGPEKTLNPEWRQDISILTRPSVIFPSERSILNTLWRKICSRSSRTMTGVIWKAPVPKMEESHEATGLQHPLRESTKADSSFLAR